MSIIFFFTGIMEGSSLELMIDANDLLNDTRRRLTSAQDVYTSNEVRRDIRFGKKT